MAHDSTSATYFKKYISPLYKRALEWDQNLCTYMQCLLARRRDVYDFGIHRRSEYIAGSCYEGGCSPRIYQSPRVVELDLFTSVKYNDVGLLLKPHPYKVGVYVFGIRLQELWQMDLYSKSPMRAMGLPSDDSPKYVKDAYKRSLDYLKSNPKVVPKWLYEKIMVPCSKKSSKGPSSASHTSIDHLNEVYLRDRVEGIHFDGWPKEAEEWANRKRMWPSRNAVNKIIQQGYHMVGKDTCSDGDLSAYVEFQITFTMSERYLAKLRTPVQKLVYLMAKTLFYAYLDLKDDDNPNIDFPSYALKISFFWLIEETPVDRWTEDNVEYLLKELFNRLLHGVNNGFVRHYFMIKANLLMNCTPKLLAKVRNHLHSILSDTNSCLQNTELYKYNLLLYGYLVLKGGQNTYDLAVYNCQFEHALTLCIAMHESLDTKAMFKYILKLLEQGKGKGLQARGYLLNEEECFLVLKAYMNLCSSVFMSKTPFLWSLSTTRITHILGRYMFGLTELIFDVFELDKQVPCQNISFFMRMHVHWDNGEARPEREKVFIPTDTVSCKAIKGTLWQRSKLFFECSEDPAAQEKGEHFKAYYNHPQTQQDLLDGIYKLPEETDVLVVILDWKLKVYRWSQLRDLIEHYGMVKQKQINRWMPKIFQLTHRESPELQMMDFARMMYLMYVSEDKRAPE